jgi:hypothetical protein
VTANPRTLKRRFQNWGVRRKLPTCVAERLKKRIQVLSFDVGLEDSEILQVLRREGDEISKYILIRLRFELGLRKRVRGVEQC